MSKEKFTTIPTIRNIYYDIYANLPIVGLNAQDLGYATDRMVLYRWSGAAWQPITICSNAGITADMPAAATLPTGSLYYNTDTNELMQVQGGAWVSITAVPGYGFLTVPIFRLFPAFGTFTTTPININDGGTANVARATIVDQYAQVTLPAALNIYQFRQWGDALNTGNGIWKIQYASTSGNWVDWVTDIPVRTTADWSNWDTSGGYAVACAIRLVCTTKDTYVGGSSLKELEVIY